MTSHVHSFEARETARSDTFHGRFVKLVRDDQVVEVVEFETTDPALQGEMTVTLTLRPNGERDP